MLDLRGRAVQALLVLRDSGFSRTRFARQYQRHSVSELWPPVPFRTGLPNLRPPDLPRLLHSMGNTLVPVTRQVLCEDSPSGSKGIFSDLQRLCWHQKAHLEYQKVLTCIGTAFQDWAATCVVNSVLGWGN